MIITKSLTLSGPKPSYAVIDITDLIVYEVKDTFVPAQAPQVTLSSNQEAVIVFTSGSSGAPKAAVLTYGNLYFNALGSNACVTIDNKSSWLLSLPLYHVSGLGILFRCLIAGAAIVVAPREETARLLQEGKATHVSMVATQLFRLLHDYAFNWPKNMQAILLGGSAMPQNILRMALEQKLPVYISYGLTEMASQVATGRLNNIEGGCARVLPHRELKIDPDGEICVRGQTLFKGYLEGDSLRLPFDQDSWFHTGDVGRLDVNGCLVVTGRKDNMFICGGENIHPEEIEAALLRIDSIMQAVVVPKEDKEFGQRPVAFIRWEKDILSDDALRTILMGQLPKFKIPCAFYPWPSQADGGGVKVSRRYFVELIKGDS